MKKLSLFIKNEICETSLKLITQHIKTKHPKEYQLILIQTSNLDKYEPKYTERLYCIVNNINDRPICMECDKENNLNFLSYQKGYPKTCSIKCFNNSKEKRKHTSDFFKNMNQTEKENRISKIKDTKKDRYGDENYNNMDKQRKTMMELYGFDSNFKIQESIEKRKETWIKNYGVDNPNKNKKVREK